MNCRFIRLLLVGVCLLAWPWRAPAPLVYRPGEGWTYEPVGAGAQWQRPRAKEQLEVAQAAFDRKVYSIAQKAAQRVSRVWPLSDYAPQAQYLVARCYEATGEAEKAFREYQKLLEKQPKMTNYDEIRGRQLAIANLYLEGKWFKLWGYIPYRSMDRTAKMFEDIVKTGPYSQVGPEAQLSVGTARERQKVLCFKAPDYPKAVKAYDTAADRYSDQPVVAAEAMYRAGLACNKQAKTPDRDQSMAGQAIARFTDFMGLFPNDDRVSKAQEMIAALRSEQARGSFITAQFYQKRRKWEGARIYYNEVLLRDPSSPYAPEARQRIDALKQRILEGSP